jgi:hypothetical protein
VVLERLDSFMVDVAAGLAAAALAPQSGWREDIYDRQPVLARGIELGVILPGDWSAMVFERVTHEPATPADIDELLSVRLDYLDVGTWEKRLAAELDLQRVSLDLHRQGKVGAGIEVDGPADRPRGAASHDRGRA